MYFDTVEPVGAKFRWNHFISKKNSSIFSFFIFILIVQKSNKTNECESVNAQSHTSKINAANNVK